MSKIMGRPTDCTPEITKEICDALSTSTHGLKALCRLNAHWPDVRIIRGWVVKYDDFYHQYIKAKASQMDWLAEEALEIAYDNTLDAIIDDNGKEKCDTEWVNRSRLKVDTIKWLTGKLAPKVYGDKTDHKHDVTVRQEDAVKDLD